MRAAIAFASISVVTMLGCASGNDDNAATNDASTDTAHDTALADTAVPDAPKDSNADVRADTPTDGGAETPADGGDAGVDSGSDTTPDTATDVVFDDVMPDSVVVDSVAVDTAIDVTDVVTLGYRHTILIDGTNDFTTASERFHTTSGDASGYFAYVTWDATNLYVGYEGNDVSGTTSNPDKKWIFAYLDVDPGAGTGATSGVKYDTETPGFPAGFGAEYYLRWKCDDTFSTLEAYATGAWSTVAVSGVTHHRTATAPGYVEFSIPLATIGAPSKVGVITLMMNETSTLEAAYAGIYTDNFVDGYHATVPLAHSLLGDFASALSPNDPSNEK
jgi:hypothetical protein